MQNIKSIILVIVTGCAALLMGGCVTVDSNAGGAELAVDALDPRVAALHEICGSLLLFDSARGRLPDTLDELAAVCSLTDAQLTDSVTDKAYKYSSRGFARSQSLGRLVLLAAPQRSDKKMWAIAVNSKSPMQATVVSLDAAAYGQLTNEEGARR